MCSCRLSVVVILFLVGYASAAAKPFDIDEIGRKLHDFGQKALPAVRGVCGFINGYQGYPQGYPSTYIPGYPQGYPQGYLHGYPQGYPQGYPHGYPQANPQGYPQINPEIQRYYPRVPSNTPQIIKDQQSPSGNALEQEDLIKFDAADNVNIPPAEIQDVFKNFDKLPKLNTLNIKEGRNFIL